MHDEFLLHESNQIVFNADDFKSVPVRSWARMRTAWIAPGGKLTFSAELADLKADFIERIMHIVIMAAPAEYTPGDEQQVQDYFPVLQPVFGNVILSTRGIFSVIAGILLSYFGLSALDSQIPARLWLKRIIAALVMLGAIILYSLA